MKVYKIKVNGKTYKVELEAVNEISSGDAPVTEAKKEEVKAAPAAPKTSNAQGEAVVSPIQGTVINVKVKPGDRVKRGDVICIIEAMKLENEVVSTADGEVADVLVSKGQQVAAKDKLIIVK